MGHEIPSQGYFPYLRLARCYGYFMGERRLGKVEQSLFHQLADTVAYADGTPHVGSV